MFYIPIKGTKMDTTHPVSTKWTKKTDGDEAKVEMCVYIPKKHQKDPPKPKGKYFQVASFLTGLTVFYWFQMIVALPLLNVQP